MSDKNETVTEDSNTDLSAQIADLQAQLEKVTSKNKEVVAEKQAMKLKAQEAKDAAEAAELTAAERSGDIEAIKAAHAKELEKFRLAAEKSDADLRTIRVDNAIATAIAEGNVKPEFVKAVTAMMKADVQYANGEASIEGQTIGEYVGTYLGSAIGAHFVRAADNSGGGATGNTSTTVQSNHGFTKENFNSKMGEWMVMAGSDPVNAKAIATQVGRNDLAKDL